MRSAWIAVFSLFFASGASAASKRKTIRVHSGACTGSLDLPRFGETSCSFSERTRRGELGFSGRGGVQTCGKSVRMCGHKVWCGCPKR